jgi:nucleotide-binding universal stress UspA family protein
VRSFARIATFLEGVPGSLVGDCDHGHPQTSFPELPLMARLRTQRIVVAYRGSNVGLRCLDRAAELTGERGEVAVVHVIHAQAVSSRLETISEREHEGQRRLLAQAHRYLSGRGVDAVLEGAAGDVATEILATVTARDADALVVGGRPGRRLHSPLSRRLVRCAPCDVFVVR